MDLNERILDTNEHIEDEENQLRPQSFDEYIGQTDLKKNLKVFVGAAKLRNETLDHVLLYGPPGLGKTTMSMIIANEMGTHLKATTGPSIEKTGDLVAILTSLEPGDVLFIDEIHRLNKVVEEILYPAMEDFYVDVVIGKEASTRSIRIDLPPFTLVGATTRAGDLSAPLRDRFGIVSKLEYYNESELTAIIDRTSQVYHMDMDEQAKRELARRSRGTPRIANRLFRRVRDFAQYNGDDMITKSRTIEALQSLKDPYGEYSIIGAVPAIFMVNKNLLGDRISPKSWADILKPEFKASISLPVADFDLFNAILVNIYKLYGENGVKALGRNLMSNMHPAEMVGSNGPTITVMPFFFSKMIRENSPMMPIWPEDGAIISPIFMLTKADKADKLKKIAEFMSGKEIGEILSHQGLFPSTNPEVSNISDEKPMMWIGWDHIYSIDMGKTIKHCEKLFKEGVDNQ